MTRKHLTIATVLVLLLMAVSAVVVAGSISDEAKLPTHWGVNGRPDAWADKWTALLIPLGVVAGASLLFYLLPSLEPRRRGLERSQGLYLAAWAGLLLIGFVMQLAVASVTLGWGIEVPRLVLGGVGLMFLLIGNQLGKSRSMYLVGIRTPWTLASEDVWIKTHRLAGKLFAISGLLMILGAFLSMPLRSLAMLMGTVVLVVVAVPLIYSFLLWRAELRASGVKAE